MLTDELDSVRRDLRRTIRAYAARLELDLAESIAAVNLTSVAKTCRGSGSTTFAI
jgi:hypothetical protein